MTHRLSAVLLLSAVACDGPRGVSLSKSEAEAPLDVPVPPANGPKLASVSHATPIHQRPARSGEIIGYMHAGSQVARAEKPYSTDDCSEGWYPIRPRGFVCVNEGASLDLRHPTLTTMAIQPNRNTAMPYTYARSKSDGAIYEVDGDREQAVRSAGTLRSRSGLAVVGSWDAADENGETRRLAMMTNGRFVDAATLERAKFSKFRGAPLGEKLQLPIAFVVKRGVATWTLDGAKSVRKTELKYHELLPLTGRFRTAGGEKFWEATDELWVRHRDVTTIRRREEFPAYAVGTDRWIDVSVITGTLVAYEGEQAVFATLTSVGKDKLEADAPGAQVTQRGDFFVTSKHVTALNANVKGFAQRVEMYDTPWTLELSSGQFIHASYWHNRFGIEHGPGNIQLSPEDAHWLWQWSTPEVPEGWHAVANLTEDSSLRVSIRK